MARKPLEITEDGKKVWARNAKGVAICGAHLNSTSEEICRCTILFENGRCRRHRGRAEKGELSTSYKHGKYVKDLPERLKARYQAAINDPEALSLRNEIALADVRLVELIQNLDTGLTNSAWKDLQERYDALIQIMNKVDTNTMIAIRGVGRAIENGRREGSLWGDVEKSAEHRRKLVESEQKRLVAMKQMVTAEQAFALVSLMSTYINEEEEIPREVRWRLSQKLGRLLSYGFNKLTARILRGWSDPAEARSLATKLVVLRLGNRAGSGGDRGVAVVGCPPPDDITSPPTVPSGNTPPTVPSVNNPEGKPIAKAQKRLRTPSLFGRHGEIRRSADPNPRGPEPEGTDSGAAPGTATD